MFVDPVISGAKFQREVDEFRAHQAKHRQRGIWLLDATFPEVFIALMAVKAPPFAAVAMFGVVINFEDYDVEPPSVRFVHPLTRLPLRTRELAHRMPRLTKKLGPDGAPATGPNGEQLLEHADLVQAEDLEREGFVCLQGVREYHAHPAHTGDSWWLHRGTGVGRLNYLANILATYGIDPVGGLNVQIGIGGLTLNPRPE